MATQYFVNPAGNNTTGLSDSTAWTTIATLNSKALSSGDIVSFKGGQTFSDAAVTAKTGVTYNSYGTGQALLQFGSTIFILTAVNNVTIDNLSLKLTGTALGGVINSSNTTSVLGGCSNITVTNCSIDGGVITRQAYTTTTFTSAGVYANRVDPSGTITNRQGLDVGWTIANNSITNTGDSGIIACGNGHTISNNTITNVGNNTSVNSTRCGIMLRAPNSIVVSNTITNAGQVGISSRYCNEDIYFNVVDACPIGINLLTEDFWALSSGTTLIHENKIRGFTTQGFLYSPVDTSKTAPGTTVSFEDLELYNNVFESGGGGANCIELKAESPGSGSYSFPVNVTVRNNVCLGTCALNIRAFPAAAGKTVNIDYNIYVQSNITSFRWNNTSSAFSTWKTSSSQDAHSTAGTDPLLSAFPGYVPDSASIAKDAGTPNTGRHGILAAYPIDTGRNFKFTARPINNVLPTTTLVTVAANDSQGLVNALAGTTAKNIIITAGTYDTAGTTAAAAGYFTINASHKIYSHDILQAVVTSGVFIPTGVTNVELHQIKFTITSGAKLYAPSVGAERGIIYQASGTPDNSGLKVTDCIIDGGGIAEYGIYSPNPNNGVYDRNVINNVQNTCIYANDGVYNSTALVTSIQDNNMSGFYSRDIRTIVGGASVARGSYNGTGEVGIRIGHRVSTFARNRMRDGGFAGIMGGNNFINTTIDSPNINLIYGTVPPTTTTYAGQATYWDHGLNGSTPVPGVQNVTVQNFLFGPDITMASNNASDNGVQGQAASVGCVWTNGLIDSNDSVHADKSVGLLFDRGTQTPTVTNVVFRNMRYACMVDLTADVGALGNTVNSQFVGMQVQASLKGNGNINTDSIVAAGASLLGAVASGGHSVHMTTDQLQLRDQYQHYTVSGATNATPIVITTAATHTLVTGDTNVVVSGVTGNTAANGTWTVTVVDTTHFSLNGSTGNGAYVSGGVVNAFIYDNINGNNRPLLGGDQVGIRSIKTSQDMVTSAQAGGTNFRGGFYVQPSTLYSVGDVVQRGTSFYRRYIATPSATAHYVSPTGSATYAQATNRSTPCSWSTAKTTWNPGDEVILLDGTYSFSSVNSIGRGGSAGNYVTIRSENPRGAKFTASSTFTGDFLQFGVIAGTPTPHSCDYIRIIGIEIDGNNYAAPIGIRVQSTQNHFEIIGCRIHHCGGNGIAMEDVDYVGIWNNDLWLNGHPSNTNGSGISIRYSGTPTLFDSYDGYHNYIVGNRVSGSEGSLSSNPSDGNGIILDNNGPTQAVKTMGNTLIFNNLVYHNGNRGIHVLGMKGASGRGILVANNTAYKNSLDMAAAAPAAGTSGDFTIQNGSSGAAEVWWENNISVPFNPDGTHGGVPFRDNTGSGDIPHLSPSNWSYDGLSSNLISGATTLGADPFISALQPPTFTSAPSYQGHLSAPDPLTVLTSFDLPSTATFFTGGANLTTLATLTTNQVSDITNTLALYNATGLTPGYASGRRAIPRSEYFTPAPNVSPDRTLIAWGGELWKHPSAATSLKLINGATNASPIVIQTSAAHGFSTGNVVTIFGVSGNTAANGSWTITSVDSTHFSLNSSTGNGAYTTSYGLVGIPNGGTTRTLPDPSHFQAHADGIVDTLLTAAARNGGIKYFTHVSFWQEHKSRVLNGLSDIGFEGLSQASGGIPPAAFESDAGLNPDTWTPANDVTYLGYFAWAMTKCYNVIYDTIKNHSNPIVNTVLVGGPHYAFGGDPTDSNKHRLPMGDGASIQPWPFDYDAFIYWLKWSHGFDFLTLDYSIVDFNDGTNANPTYIKAQVGNMGTLIQRVKAILASYSFFPQSAPVIAKKRAAPIDFIEWYYDTGVPGYTGGSGHDPDSYAEDVQAMCEALVVRQLYMNGARKLHKWAAMGDASGAGGTMRNISSWFRWTNAPTATNSGISGNITNTGPATKYLAYDAVKLFADNFPVGTQLYNYTHSDPDLVCMASDTKILVINTNLTTTKTFTMGGVSRSLAAKGVAVYTLSTLSQSNNDATQRGTRSPTGIAAVVTTVHPSLSA